MGQATMPATDRILAAADGINKGHSPVGFRKFSDEVKELRLKLGLTQEQFATKYHIPIGNLRNWEQNTRVSSPDTASRVLISIIAVNPEKVAELIKSSASLSTTSKSNVFEHV